MFLCKTKHKSGFVSIIGYPNAGKSTLVNALVGEKLSIVNAKVQTTRDRILGIYNSENYQIGTVNHDVSQNYMALLDSIESDIPFKFSTLDVDQEEIYDILNR